jgi:hypothetical protein
MASIKPGSGSGSPLSLPGQKSFEKPHHFYAVLFYIQQLTLGIPKIFFHFEVFEVVVNMG